MALNPYFASPQLNQVGNSKEREHSTIKGRQLSSCIFTQPTRIQNCSSVPTLRLHKKHPLCFGCLNMHCWCLVPHMHLPIWIQATHLDSNESAVWGKSSYVTLVITLMSNIQCIVPTTLRLISWMPIVMSILNKGHAWDDSTTVLHTHAKQHLLSA